MSQTQSVTHWIAGIKAGDEEAAQGLWQRYFDKLVRLAMKKLTSSQKRVADEEDVALSAFHSLCDGAQKGKFPLLQDREDLWKLLVVITARKACDQKILQYRQKRGGGQVRGESVFVGSATDSALAGIEQVVGDEPTPEFAALVAEQTSAFLAELNDDTLRRIAQMRLEQYKQTEIAEALGVSEETIRRKLHRIRLVLEATRNIGGD